MRVSLIEVGGKEIPGQVSLIIYIPGCNVGCIDCHSKEFWPENSGDKYTNTHLKRIFEVHRDFVDCVCFMGGEWDLDKLFESIQIARDCGLKTALYTGKEWDDFDYDIQCKFAVALNYIKCGPYIAKHGGLENVLTNQYMYEIVWSHYEYMLRDITSEFWEK